MDLLGATCSSSRKWADKTVQGKHNFPAAQGPSLVYILTLDASFPTIQTGPGLESQSAAPHPGRAPRGGREVNHSNKCVSFQNVLPTQELLQEPKAWETVL